VGANPPSSVHRLPAIVAWVCGTSVGYLGMTGRVTTTGIGAMSPLAMSLAFNGAFWERSLSIFSFMAPRFTRMLAA
jgi:hypothetical protein